MLRIRHNNYEEKFLKSPATFLDERQGWDRNIEFIDYSYLTILEGLEKINDKFSASIKLDEEQKGD